MKQRARSSIDGRGGRSLFVVALWTIFALGPLVLVVLNSFRTTSAIYNSPIGLPSSGGAANFRKAWSQASFSTYVLNSLLVTGASLILGIGVAVLAAYPLGRKAFPGRDLFAAIFLMGLLLPAQLGIVPIFRLLERMHLIDSRLGLVLVYATQTLPLAVLILSTFFRQLPGEIEEAARLDGASEARIFRSVLLPLVRPAIATVAVVQAAPIWNDFFYPLVLIRSDDKHTLPVGLTRFFGQYQSDFGVLFAALVIVSLPLIVLFIAATKQVIAGLTAGTGK